MVIKILPECRHRMENHSESFNKEHWYVQRTDQSQKYIIMEKKTTLEENNRRLDDAEERIQFSSVAQSCLTLCGPMDCSTPGFPVHHQLLELKLMSVESVMPSSHLILCHPFLPPSIFPSIRVFSKEFLTLGGQIIGVSASASVLPMNIQDWFPLGLTGWIFTTLEYRLEGITQSEQQKEKFFKWA